MKQPALHPHTLLLLKEAIGTQQASSPEKNEENSDIGIFNTASVVWNFLEGL